MIIITIITITLLINNDKQYTTEGHSNVINKKFIDRLFYNQYQFLVIANL